MALAGICWQAYTPFHKHSPHYIFRQNLHRHSIIRVLLRLYPIKSPHYIFRQNLHSIIRVSLRLIIDSKSIIMLLEIYFDYNQLFQVFSLLHSFISSLHSLEIHTDSTLKVRLSYNWKSLPGKMEKLTSKLADKK